MMLVIRLQASKSNVFESVRKSKTGEILPGMYYSLRYATTSRDNWIRSRIAHAMPRNLRETYLSRVSMAIPIHHHLRVNYACRLSGMTTSAPKQADDDARRNPSMYYLVIAPTEI